MIVEKLHFVWWGIFGSVVYIQSCADVSLINYLFTYTMSVLSEMFS